MVFEKTANGSIGYSAENSPHLRYGRDYFSYQGDTLQKTMALTFHKDPPRKGVLSYSLQPDRGLVLQGKMGEDSLEVVLRKKPKHYRLQTHPIHLVSPTPW